MSIIQDDYRFAEIDQAGLPVPFGTAGDCFSANTSNCRRGSFMMDLSGTGLRVKQGITWRVTSDTPGVSMQEFENHQGIIVSAKCGGWCGHCQPNGALQLDLLSCKRKSSEFVISIMATMPIRCIALFDYPGDTKMSYQEAASRAWEGTGFWFSWNLFCLIC